ncbi:hypothetical protein VNO77_03848 [Canavalia gladiata]|uniref:Uncharacterized protein n=1 Tax=Canavalia gladiata TaxID=3824 RepID=A0AAN9MXI0_CANGL
MAKVAAAIMAGRRALFVACEKHQVRRRPLPMRRVHNDLLGEQRLALVVLGIKTNESIGYLQHSSERMAEGSWVFLNKDMGALSKLEIRELTVNSLNKIGEIHVFHAPCLSLRLEGINKLNSKVQLGIRLNFNKLQNSGVISPLALCVDGSKLGDVGGLQ